MPPAAAPLRSCLGTPKREMASTSRAMAQAGRLNGQSVFTPSGFHSGSGAAATVLMEALEAACSSWLPGRASAIASRRVMRRRGSGAKAT